MDLIVFDLDFTLWNAGGTWCDHTFPPYRKVDGYIIDSAGNKIHLYPDTKKILEYLSAQGYDMAIASRTHQAGWAMELLQLFEIDSFFTCHQIFPGSKIAHFKNLHKETNIDFSHICFFDDEIRNISEVGQLGVKTILVNEGISWPLVEKNLGQK